MPASAPASALRRWPSLSAFTPSAAARGLAAALVAHDARWREREAMRRLDDRTLRDIGVARADLDAALRSRA